MLRYGRNKGSMTVMRFLDISIAFLGLFFLLPIMALIAFIGFFDTGSPFFKQKRMGKNKVPFLLFKFRTMFEGTASIATHLNDGSSITPFGRKIRRLKLDELPQLWNVLIGDMSIVGPRPNLLEQRDVEKERDAYRVYNVRPGITGLAQVSGIDMSTPTLLAKTDRKMIDEMSVFRYLYYIIQTLHGKGRGDRYKSNGKPE